MSRPIVDARERLLSSGKKMLLQKGYFALSITQLTRACHMATGTFYSYFPSKAELAECIIQADWEIMLAAMDGVVNSAASFDDKLREIYTRLKGFVDMYGVVWIQFGSDRSNMERFSNLKDMYVYQVSGRVEQILREVTVAHEEISLPVTVDNLDLIIVKNMLIIARTQAFTFTVFEEALWKWALVTEDGHRINQPE